MIVNQFAAKIKALIKQQPSKLCIACSGGSDSIALTILASKVFDIVAVTIDHGLRPESGNEANYVHKLLEKLGIEHNILKCERGEIKQGSGNIQAKARRARYNLLTDFCKSNNISHLLTAHTKDDLVENFLIRLERGSGIDGLSAIDEISRNESDIYIVRPLLEFSKTELQEYLQNQEIEWVEDPSNQNEEFKRVKFRKILEKFDDKFKSRIVSASLHIKRASIALNHYTKLEYEILVERHKNNLVFKQGKFKGLEAEIRYRVLVKIIEELSGIEYKPRFNSIQRLDNFICGNEGKAMTLSYCKFMKKLDTILVSRELGRKSRNHDKLLK